MEIEFGGDLGNVQPPELVPDGTYNARIEGVEVAVSEKKADGSGGAPYMRVEYLLEGNGDPAVDGEPLSYFVSLPGPGDEERTPKKGRGNIKDFKLRMLKEFLTKVGSSAANSDKLETVDLIGRTCQVRVGRESYNGRLQNRIVGIV